MNKIYIQSKNINFDLIIKPTSEAGKSLLNEEKVFSKKQATETLTYNPSEKTFIKDLEEIKNDYSCEDWDGYGAKPICKNSISYAEQFVALRPPYIDFPELTPHPNGLLGMQWLYDKNHLIISIDEHKMVYYALIANDSGKHRGRVYIDFKSGELPRSIIMLFKLLDGRL
jgi:hypothetical protein